MFHTIMGNVNKKEFFNSVIKRNFNNSEMKIYELKSENYTVCSILYNDKILFSYKDETTYFPFSDISNEISEEVFNSYSNQESKL